MTRRLIAGLLTLCMLVSLCPPNAFALRSSAAVVPETESTVVEPAAEEPKAKEPAAEEPAAEDPAAEDPQTEDPAAEEPKAEEPAAEEPAVEEPQTEDTPAEDPAAEDPQTEDPAAEDPKAEEETPKYATVNVNGSVKLTASAEDGGKWASDNIAAATVGAEKADAGEKNVAEVFGVAEGSTTVTYTVGDEKEVWKITVTAAPAEETPAEEEPADVTYSVSRYLEEKAPEGSEVPFTYTQIDTISVTGKPGAEVTLPAVDGAVAVNTDAEDVLPNDDGTATLTLPAETPEELSLTVYYVKTESRPEIDDLTIVEPGTKIDTYKFVVDGGTVSTQKIKAGETVYAPASPEKEGYKFTGWFSGSDAFVPGTKTSVSGTTYTYTAAFTPVYYVFFLNTAGVVCATREGVTNEVISADVTFPVDADQAITGWYTDPDRTNKVTSVTINGANITLYPKVETGAWITFDSQGGSYTAPAFVNPNGVTVAPANPTRVGYTFQGWYNGDTPFTFGSELTENVTLTAHWQGNPNTRYTVIHWQENVDDDNFSFQESETKTGTAGETTAASAKSYEGFTAREIEQQTISGDGSTIVNVYYERNEYTINFWPTNGSSSSSKTPICGKEQHTHSSWYNTGYGECYADAWEGKGQWYLTCTKEEHTHVDTCYETSSSGALFTITAKYGANISDQWPSRSNGSTNWAKGSDGSGPYQAGIDVMPLNGGNFYVPSDESSNSLSASYYVEVLEGEQGTVVNGRTYKLHHTDTVMMKEAYVSDEDFYDITGFSKNTTDSTKNKRNYNGAKFYYYRNSYEIQFINNGPVEHTVTKQYEADISDVSYTPTRPASIPAEYVFVGWYDNELGQGEKYVFSGKMPAKSITVYAKWAAPEFEGTAYLTMAGGEPQTIAIPYGSKIDEADLPTEEAKAKMPDGYTWRGWAVRSGDAPDYVYTPFNFDTLIYDNITLYPYYTSNQSFKVTYNANGGTGTAPSDTKTYADGSYADVMTASNLIAPEGKVFLGWGTEENGGVIYQPGDKIAVHVADITLYAIWGDKAALATLTYNPNGGTGTVTTENYLNNESVTLKSDTELGFTRTGYKFLGWSTNSTATEAEYLANAAIIVDNKSPNTLYAVWKKMDFQVTYSYTGTVPTGAPALPDGDTGTEGIQPFVHTYGTTVNVQTAPTLPGYTFSGWTTTDAEVSDGSFTMPDKNVAFTGSWTANEAKIEFVENGGVEVADMIGTTDAEITNTEMPTTSKNGYTFAGWYDNSEFTGTAVTALPDAYPAGTTTYYAKWTIRTDLSYTVNYLEKGTTNVLATAKTQGNQTFGTEITSADEVISINGYNFDSADKEKLTIGTGENVINLYYTKRTDLSYTVNYYWMGTTTKIADSKTVDKQTFDAKVTESAIDVAGYTKADPTEKTITIAVEGNEINFYYYKNVTVTADNKSKTYGSADPELTATVSGTLGSDTVTYTVSRAEGETVGTYDITPSGEEIQGNYKVSYEEGVFTITAQSINPVGPDPENPDPNYTGATVDSPADHVYDSKEHKYEPVVKNGKSETLTKGTDYTVTYDRADFVNVGTIKVTITGIGNYSGTVTREYKITPASVTVTADNKSKTYGSADPELTASVEGTIGTDTVSYTVTRAEGENAGTYTITASGAATQGNYTVTYVPGTLTITAQSITPGPDSEDPDPSYLGVTVGNLKDVVYNGLSQEQEPVVKDKNKVDLVKGTDYTLSYSTDTTNVGTVTVTVTGIGNYTGTVTRTYEITPAPYTVTTYSAIKVYDGHPLTAGGQVNGLVNGETCTVNTTASRTEYGSTENKPYTLTWGTANKNNYEFKGETIGTLTVVRQSINPTDPPIPTDPDGEKPIDPDQSYYGGVEVKAPENVKYNGQLQEQKPAVTDKDGTPLAEGTDYTLSWTSATDVGTVTVTVTGKGNYQGEVKVTYQITPRHVTLTSEGGTKPYDGTPLIKPGVAVGGDGFVAGEVTGLKATGTVTNVTETPVINTITYTTGADFKATNYIIEKAEGELSITKAEVGVVTVSGLRNTYWWTGAEREVTGFIHDGEDRLITVTIKDKDKAVARGTEVGRYYMGLKETDFTAESPNYYKVVVKVEDGYLDIVPINITVTVTVRGNRDTVTYDGNPHTVEGYEVVSAIANTGRDMGMDGITLKFKGDASVTGTEVGTYDMGLKASDFTVECDIYRVVRVVVEDGQLEITPAPEEPTEEIPDETVPLAPPEEIPDEPVPQAGPAWALINLILSILTVLASLLLLVGYFGKKEEEAEDENGNAILDAEGNNVMNDIKKRGGWRLASLVPAILSVIAFLLTENMRNPMILVDRWTLLMVIIAVVQVLVMLLSKKKTEDNTQEA